MNRTFRSLACKTIFCCAALAHPVANVLAQDTGAVDVDAESDVDVDTDVEPQQSISQVLGEQDDNSDQYTHLEQRIERAEAGSAQRELETIVAQVEAVYHPSHPELVRPLTLLGDSLYAQQEYVEALDTYGRALYIARVNSGLFDASQLEIIYREVDTYSQLGDLTEARNREEYAYEIMKRGFADYDPALVEGLKRLARFYLATHNYLAARVFYQRSLTVHRANGTDMSMEAVEALRGIAFTYRMERFPTFHLSSRATRADGPAPGLAEGDLGMQHVSINNFHEGERALQSIVRILQAQVPVDKVDLRDSIMELADWHLLWARSNEANTLYAYVFKEMTALGENPNELFGAPTLIYLPEPRPPTPPSPALRLEEEQGVVTLQMQVLESGRIKKLKTIHSHPPKLMDFQIRRSMRLAVFRPLLTDGVAQTVDDFTYTYEFPYFPSSKVAPSAPASETSDPTVNSTATTGGNPVES